MSEEIAGYGENWESDHQQLAQLEELRRLRRLRFGIPESSSESSPKTSRAPQAKGHPRRSNRQPAARAHRNPAGPGRDSATIERGQDPQIARAGRVSCPKIPRDDLTGRCS